MIQLKQRTTSLSYSDAERDVINQRLIEYQEQKGILFSSFKELFSTLLLDALQVENKEPKEIIKEVQPEFMLISCENKEEFNEMNLALENYRERLELPSDISNCEVVKTALKTVVNNPEIVEVEKVVEKFIEKELEYNQILITLTENEKVTVEKKLTLLDEIAARRQRKYKFAEKESIAELIEKMVFNDGSVFNLSGEFFTGF